MQKLGPIQQKILVLLLGGVALALNRSPRRQLKILRDIGTAWKDINRRALNRAIKSLYQSRLIEEKHHPDGSITLILSKSGQREAQRFNLHTMRIVKPHRWDKKWRAVLFDIPETKKNLRDAFRWHLHRLGFHELQKSVFVHPYECQKELNFLIEFYRARQFIRLMTVEAVDNELHLKKHFGLA